MFIVHKPYIFQLLLDTNQSHNVNFTVNLSSNIEVSFAFDDSCGRLNSCSLNYVLVTQGEDELYNVYGLPNDTLQTLIGLACLDNWIAVRAILESIS